MKFDTHSIRVFYRSNPQYDERLGLAINNLNTTLVKGCGSEEVTAAIEEVTRIAADASKNHNGLSPANCVFANAILYRYAYAIVFGAPELNALTEPLLALACDDFINDESNDYTVESPIEAVLQHGFAALGTCISMANENLNGGEIEELEEYLESIKFYVKALVDVGGYSPDEVVSSALRTYKAVCIKFGESYSWEIEKLIEDTAKDL